MRCRHCACAHDFSYVALAMNIKIMKTIADGSCKHFHESLHPWKIPAIQYQPIALSFLCGRKNSMVNLFKHVGDYQKFRPVLDYLLYVRMCTMDDG